MGWAVAATWGTWDLRTWGLGDFGTLGLWDFGTVELWGKLTKVGLDAPFERGRFNQGDCFFGRPASLNIVVYRSFCRKAVEPAPLHAACKLALIFRYVRMYVPSLLPFVCIVQTHTHTDMHTDRQTNTYYIQYLPTWIDMVFVARPNQEAESINQLLLWQEE